MASALSAAAVRPGRARVVQQAQQEQRQGQRAGLRGAGRRAPSGRGRFRAAHGEAMGNKFSGARLRSIVQSPPRRQQRQQAQQERCDTETEQDLENFVAELQMLEGRRYLSPRKASQRVRADSAGGLDSEELDLDLDLPEHLRLQ